MLALLGPADLATWLLLPGAVAGHFVLWLACISRFCGLGWPSSVTDPFEKAYAVAMFLALGAVAVPLWLPAPGPVAWAYPAACLAALAVAVPVGLARRVRASLDRTLLAQRATTHRLPAPLAEPVLLTTEARVWSLVPGNEMLHVEATEKELRLPRLPAALDGFTILHLSDLHVAGVLGRPFYRLAAEVAARFDPDLVVVTGDLADEAEFVEWLPELFGGLRGRHGVHFVLGNHDLRVPVAKLRTVLAELGWNDLGGRTTRLRHGLADVVLGGNELPWFGPAAEFPADVVGEPSAFRIALAHTPDRIVWARRRGIDLLLAGHVHGGQVRLPLIGAIAAPSLYGVEFAAGVFRRGPTVMHVSRGLSALHPLRLGCPPEVALLTLRSAEGA